MSVSVVEHGSHEIAVPSLDSHVERLAEHGEMLAHWLARPRRSPPKWRTSTFARNVDLVRAHLQPINSPGLLANSYGREHFNLGPVGVASGRDMLGRDATEVAYALRWLELVEGQLRPRWLDLLLAGERP